MEQLLTSDQIKVLYRANFTKKQAGLYMGIGETTIRELIDSGKLGVTRIAGKEFISRAECDRLIKENTRYKSKFWKSK